MPTIELDEAPLFIVPGKIHLSIEDRGPISFDPATLSEEEKGWINNAHFLKKVKVDNVNKETKGAVIQVSKPAVQDQKPLVHPNKDAEEEKIKNLLKLPMASLKKDLKGSNNFQLLRAVKVQEQLKKKPRSSLLKVVNDRLDHLQSLVTQKIGTEDVGDKLNPVRVGAINSDFVSEVTDQDERKVVVRPATEDDFTDLEVTDE